MGSLALYDVNDVVITLWCHQTWLAGKSPTCMEVSKLGKSRIDGAFSSQPCLITGAYWLISYLYSLRVCEVGIFVVT